MPGVMIIREQVPIGKAIEGIILIAECGHPEEWNALFNISRFEIFNVIGVSKDKAKWTRSVRTRCSITPFSRLQVRTGSGSDWVSSIQYPRSRIQNRTRPRHPTRSFSHYILRLLTQATVSFKFCPIPAPGFLYSRKALLSLALKISGKLTISRK